ncbi:hypothetical protein APSETT445_005133 [Aspergillus pseudonomiae]
MYRIRRGILKKATLTPKSISRNISLTSHGEPIQYEQLFEYTNGRFLVNEKHELSKRYAKFDLDALCTVVSSLPSVSSPISQIDKLEGGFNKALLMTAENGNEVTTKIPCPSVVPAEYSTASEAASLEYGLTHAQHSTLVPRGPHFGGRVEHIHILETAMKIIPKLVSYSNIQRFSRPTLWHGDLHLGNIFVCNKDPTRIVGIIDWQFVSIMPAFMQVQWPSFISPPENYEIGIVKPDLPPNFDEMDSDEKAYAITERDQALLSKCYEAALAKYHVESYLALTQVDSVSRDSFSLTQNTWKHGIIPLRDSLVQISENWRQIGLSGSCGKRGNRDNDGRVIAKLNSAAGIRASLLILIFPEAELAWPVFFFTHVRGDSLEVL